MPEVQTTFSDLQNIQHVKALTPNQRMIISLLSCGLTQTGIADRLHFSKPYINQVIKKLESLNLVKRIRTQRAKEGTRAYNYFYEVATEAKVPNQPFTICRVHNIKKKFKIFKQSGPTTIDKRASWSKSWNMRGGPRHKFWYPGKAGLPSVTIDWHPGTLVIYVDKGQKIPARDIAQAKEIAWYALLQAKDRFIKEQDRFGVTFEIETVGEDIAKIHMGFAFDDRSAIAQDKINLPHWWIDKSPAEQLGPHVREVETDVEGEANALERGIRDIQHLPITVKTSIQEAMPEAMKEFEKSFGPLTSEIHTVMAHLQSGEPLQYKVDQLIVMFGKVLEQQGQILNKMNNKSN